MPGMVFDLRVHEVVDLDESEWPPCGGSPSKCSPRRSEVIHASLCLAVAEPRQKGLEVVTHCAHWIGWKPPTISMALTLQTPCVYIQEVNAFPNPVVAAYSTIDLQQALRKR
jgi:hypothetical protein